MPTEKKGKENDIMHLSPDPLPPEPIMTNLNNDKLFKTGPPTLLQERVTVHIFWNPLKLQKIIYKP